MIPLRIAWVGSFIVEETGKRKYLYKEMRLKAGPLWEEHNFVFCTLHGRFLEKSRLHQMFGPLLQKAGVSHIRFHDLRHSAATFLLSMGIHPKMVQELLGHSSISITLDIYSHVLPTMQEELAQKLDHLYRD